jgi:hypothetical protein
MDYNIHDIKSNQAGKYGKACIDFILNAASHHYKLRVDNRQIRKKYFYLYNITA